MNPLDLKRMTRLELFELAKSNNLRVTSTMTKAELIETIQAAEKRSKVVLEPSPKEPAPSLAKGKETRKAEKAPPKAEKAAPAPPKAEKAAPTKAEKAPAKATKNEKEGPKVEKAAPKAQKAPKESAEKESKRPAARPPIESAAKRAIRALEEAEAKMAEKASAKKQQALEQEKAAEKEASGKRIESAKRLARKIVSGDAARKPALAKEAAQAKKEPEPAKKAAQIDLAAKKEAAPPKRPERAARAKALSKRAEPSKRPTEEEIRHMAEEGKYYLGAEQRIMPPVEAIDIPTGYNVDRIVVLVRDPFWIFAYWEVTDRKRRELERIFGETWPQCRMVLRVYDLTETRREHFDITLTNEAHNWYINVSAARRYQVAVGALSPDGRFEQIAISNIVETPSGRVSDRVDEHWMIPDEVFDKIFAASGGLDMHASSAELRGLMERHLLEQITSGSGAISSFVSGAWPARKGRGFRLWVATELILYGGTDPDARVTVQGKEVKLRPDGTFSLRFALPDGKLELPVEAESADGVETRRIETGVTKKSTTKEPVVK